MCMLLHASLWAVRKNVLSYWLLGICYRVSCIHKSYLPDMMALRTSEAALASDHEAKRFGE